MCPVSATGPQCKRETLWAKEQPESLLELFDHVDKDQDEQNRVSERKQNCCER